MDFDVRNLLAGGAIIGLVAGFWDKIKACMWRLANTFVQQIEIPTEAAHDALVSYLISKYRRSRLYDRMYGASYEYQRDGRYGLVPFEVFGNRTMIFWNGMFPFLFANSREKKTTRTNDPNAAASEATKIFSTLTFIRGTLDVDDLLRKACATRNDLAWNVASEEECKKNRFCINFFPKRSTEEGDYGWGTSNNGLAWYQQGHYRLLAHAAEQLGKAPTHNGKALDNLIFPARIKELLREIELWCKSKSWYLEKGIPWKRGWLLYGPPGTGKTALARAFAEDLNLPIYVFNLAEMGNLELIKAWNEMQVNLPCIALIEDIDNVFHGRENVTRKNHFMGMMFPKKQEDDKNHDRPLSSPLTFDCLLNCLDGVERSDGVFTIITTNDIAKVDPALGQPRKLPDGSVEFISTRPGRIDKAVELSYMELPDRKRMARRILASYPDDLAEMLEFVDKYPDLQETPAQFQERCGQIALRRFWEEQNQAKIQTRPKPLLRQEKGEEFTPARS